MVRTTILSAMAITVGSACLAAQPATGGPWGFLDRATVIVDGCGETFPDRSSVEQYLQKRMPSAFGEYGLGYAQRVDVLCHSEARALVVGYASGSGAVVYIESDTVVASHRFGYANEVAVLTGHRPQSPDSWWFVTLYKFGDGRTSYSECRFDKGVGVVRCAFPGAYDAVKASRTTAGDLALEMTSKGTSETFEYPDGVQTALDAKSLEELQPLASTRKVLGSQHIWDLYEGAPVDNSDSVRHVPGPSAR